MWIWIGVLLSAVVSVHLVGTEELDGPRLLAGPASLTHFSNSVGLTLSCQAEGPGPLTTTWLTSVGDELLPLPGIREQLANGSLHIWPFKPEEFIPAVHAGAYRCSVRNPIGTFVSPVLGVRAIIDQPFEVGIKSGGEWVEGSPAWLECGVSPGFYSGFVKAVGWKEIDQFGHEREIRVDGVKYQMGCDGSLLIMSAKVQQLFVCIAQNQLNMRMVASPPFLFKAERSSSKSGGPAPESILSRKLCAGDEQIARTDLLCLGRGNPSPSFRWEKYVPGLVGEGQLLQLSGSGPLLQLPSPSPNETYHCTAHNAFGTYSVNFSISASKSVREVTVEPERLLAKVGQTVEFTCRAGRGGEGPYGLSWVKDGKPIPDKGDSRVKLVSGTKLVIFNVGLGDQGVYQCFNQDGSATNGGTLLFDAAQPQLVHTFISQSLQPGPSLSLKCSAVGNPLPEIKWEVDGLILEGSEGSGGSSSKGFWSERSQRVTIGEGRIRGEEVVSHLNISEVRVEDGGNYKCTAINLMGKVGHGARLNVYGSIFVKEMAPLTLVHGERVQIHCRYGGWPVDKVGWEREGKPIKDSDGYRIWPNGTLEIGRVSTDKDKGSYSCRISNRKGEMATGSVLVNVMHAPVVSQFKFDPGLKEGQRTSVSCNVISGDAPIEIRWRKDGQLIPARLNVTENRVRFISFLIFDELREEHGGEYTCSASNAAKVVNQSAKLEVRVPPKWRVEPKDAKVILKGDHVLQCAATGVPPPTITWCRDLNGVKSSLRTNHKYRLGPNGTLTILQVEEFDSSNYTCEAGNGVGTGLSRTIRLDVIIPAKISAVSRTVTVAEGGKAILQCRVLGDPIQLESIWKRNSTVILSGREGKTRQKLVEEMEGTRRVLTAQLEMRRVEMGDSGTYTCLASNLYGRDEDMVVLQVKARPKPPENFAVEEIGSRFVRLTWAKPQPSGGQNEPISKFMLQWRKSSPNPGWNNASSGLVFNMSVGQGQTNAVIRELVPVTGYDVRAFAWNEIGEGLPTGTLVVLTLPEAPSGPPRNVSAMPLGPKSLFVKWEPPEKELQHGNILGYQVVAQLQMTGANPSFGGKNGTVVVDQKWKSQSEVKGLRPNSQYRLGVKAYNGAGMGPESGPLYVQMPEGPPDSPPVNLGCEPLSPKSLQVQWDPPPQHLSNGHILGYKVSYHPSQGGRLLGLKPEVKKTSNRETTLHGLKSYTSYAIKVLAYTTGGESEVSFPANCTTEEDVPEEPADVKVLQTGGTSVLISWLPPREMNGVLTKYIIFWRVEETGLVKERQYVPPSPEGQEHALEIRRLKEGLKYGFWVKAATNAGAGRPSKTETSLVGPSPSVPARIASFPMTKHVLKDHPVRLPCKSVGSPPPKVTWLKGGTRLVSQSLLRNGSLVIPQVRDEDEGEYSCHAENELGSDEIHHQLIISRPPSPPQIYVGYVTDSSIQLHWEPPDKADPPLTSYLLEYQQGGSGAQSEWKQLRLDSFLSSYSLESLLCGSLYRLRLLAENGVGRSEPTELITTRTNGNPPESAPRLTEVVDGNWTMIRINLHRWPDGGCPLRETQVEYRKQQATGGGSGMEWRKVYGIENGTKVFVFQTVPESKYQIRIRLENDAGSVRKTFSVESHPDFFMNYAKVLERVEVEERLNGGGSSSLVPFYTDPHVLVPIVSAVICTAALTVCVLMLIKRKNQPKSEWKFHPSSNQQSWLSSSDQQSGSKGDDGSSKCGTEECMSIYATLNSTQPIHPTIRDSTVRLQSFGQQDNYDVAPPQRREGRGSKDYLKKSRRKSKSASPLEEMCLEQVSCQLDFPSKIEPPREFRSSTSISSQQLQQLPHPHPPHPYQLPKPYRGSSSDEGEDDADEGGNERRGNGGFRREEEAVLYHDYSSPYQFKPTEVCGGKQPSRPGTLKKKQPSTKASNKGAEYF